MADGFSYGSIQLPSGYSLVNPGTGRGYRIGRVLGQGGFGITYMAQSLENGMPLAIKEFFPDGLAGRGPGGALRIMGDEVAFHGMLNSFFKEATVLFELRGLPSVVQIYDYFYANNTAYTVMEYVQGGTLLQYLQCHGKLSVAESQGNFRQLMQDIARLHRRGVIHRDISPDNIMIGGDGRFKLVDFGSARAYKGASRMTVNLKKDFAPLEQYSSSGQGTYTDVYSLAATMYYCYTGQLVPSANDRDYRDTYIRPSALGVNISPAKEQALAKALAIRASNRFQTMDEFERAFFGGGTAASGSGFEASWARIKQEPVLPIISAALFVMALLIQLIA